MSDHYDPKNWMMLSQRQRMSPFPNYMSMEAVCNEMRKFVGTNLKEVLLFFQENVFFAFQHTETFEKAAQNITHAIHKKPKLYHQLVKQQHVLGNRLISSSKKAGKRVTTKTTNRELYTFFATYEKHYKDVYASYGSVWSMESVFLSDLLKIIQKRTANLTEASDILNILTKQPRAMVATVERKALLALGITISKQAKWQKSIQENNLEAIRKNKKLNSLIQLHYKNFFWITRDYEDPILNYEKIVERLKEKLHGDVNKEYKTLKRELHDDLQKRKAYEKSLKLSSTELALFAAMRDAAELKELRKKYVSQSLYYFDPVLSEIGKRLYLSIRQVRFMRTTDVQQALLEGTDFTHELNERIKLSAWFAHNGKETSVKTGKEAEELFNKFCKADKNAKEFTGMPVSPGVARGPVKLVMNPDECDKVKKGDIIVSIQVVPSFSTAIIKSAGIVCDGGHGITSHPATLAREAGIPCVIQTRFAREVLKDGDMVEVDGYKGIVRKLN